MNFKTFDEAYVSRLKNGEHETERHFAVYFRELIAIKLRARLRSPDVIEDVIQETLLRVLRSLRQNPGIEFPEHLGAFVNSVCNNVLLEHLRSAARRESLPEQEPEDQAPNPEMQASDLSERNLILRVLEDLPAKDRMLLQRIFFEDADRKELCREFKVDQEYLRVLLHRAKGRFRSALQETKMRKQVG